MVIADSGGISNPIVLPDWGNDIDIEQYSNNQEFKDSARTWLSDFIGEEFIYWMLVPYKVYTYKYLGETIQFPVNEKIMIVSFKEYEDAWFFLEWLEEYERNRSIHSTSIECEC